MKRIRAMDPLLAGAMASSRAVEVALIRNWKHLVFDTDSKFLGSDIVNSLVTRWKIEDLVLFIRKGFKAQTAWSLH